MDFGSQGRLGTGEEFGGQTPWSIKRRGRPKETSILGKVLGVKAPGVKSPAGSRRRVISGGYSMGRSPRKCPCPLGNHAPRVSADLPEAWVILSETSETQEFPNQ
jgi:hypothetical protein